MKFPPAATYRSKIAKDAASPVMVPNRIAPRLSTLTLRADGESLPIVVYRMPPRSQLARARSQTPAARRSGAFQALEAVGYRAEQRVGEGGQARIDLVDLLIGARGSCVGGELVAGGDHR